MAPTSDNRDRAGAAGADRERRSPVERADRFQRRHPAIGFPLAVTYKFFDDQGAYLAALITYYGFVSLFPLLLLATTVLGIVLRGDPALQQQLLNSALSQVPLVGSQLRDPQGFGSHGVGLAVGIVGTLYGALGVAQAAQNAMNVVWAVPRNSRPNPLLARARSLLLVGTVGLAVVATFVSTTIVQAVFGDRLGSLSGWGVRGASLVVDSAIFLLGFHIAVAERLRVRDLAAGAVIASVVLQLMQGFGTRYATRVVARSSEVNSVFATVLGLLAWIFVVAIGFVVAAEVDVVRVRRLYPRALLTPFTDAVDLTHADERAYTHNARAARNKGFQRIEVNFEPRPDRRAADGGPDTPGDRDGLEGAGGADETAGTERPGGTRSSPSAPDPLGDPAPWVEGR